ncbi:MULTISPECIES: SufE family protein [Halomonadaceae]|uniref:SufE family protein n=1 Tax=Halomonadaceae TaxID=28256 RepID=UPI00159A7E1B|nr:MULTISPECIES: SufE family protein [Halomonas]QJQ96637.1 SufE family protein [Halomonas sp. PA5]
MKPQEATPQAAQQELVDEFAMFDNWMDRYQYIIDMGKQLPAFPPEWKSDELKIQGCQSNVWMRHELEGERLRFDATSDAAIVSGLIAVLLRIYNHRTAEEIVATEPRFIEALGLDQHLSPTRSNGLHAMLKRIYDVAEKKAASA